MAFYESVLVFRQDLTEPQVKEKAANSVKSSRNWVVM